MSPDGADLVATIEAVDLLVDVGEELSAELIAPALSAEIEQQELLATCAA